MKQKLKIKCELSVEFDPNSPKNIVSIEQQITQYIRDLIKDGCSNIIYRVKDKEPPFNYSEGTATRGNKVEVYAIGTKKARKLKKKWPRGINRKDLLWEE